MERQESISSLRSRVFLHIQSGILDGRYQPGEALVEARLSEELGVSRTPVREAIRQLELEGLVVAVPNKGAVVRGVSEQDIEDIYTIRMRIEGLASRWAAEKITSAELAEMEEALTLEAFYTQKKDAGHVLKFDSRFHEIIFAACKSAPLQQTLMSFHNYVRRARNVSLGSEKRAAEVLDEHRAIYEAIRSGKADEAEELTVEHIRKAKENILRMSENIRKT